MNQIWTWNESETNQKKLGNKPEIYGKSPNQTHNGPKLNPEQTRSKPDTNQNEPDMNPKQTCWEPETNPIYTQSKPRTNPKRIRNASEGIRGKGMLEQLSSWEFDNFSNISFPLEDLQEQKKFGYSLGCTGCT